MTVVRGLVGALRYVAGPPFERDLQLRVPHGRQARALRGFEATTIPAEMLGEDILWIRADLGAGLR